ncbi:MAG: phosphate signaling complex protein PhoU [Gemmatimonadota bacterium]
MNTVLASHVFVPPTAGVRSLLLEMGALAEVQVRACVAALVRADPELATAAILRDPELDAMELEVDEASLTLLARRHPVAADLRLVVAAMRTARELERIGDHAVGIAHAVRDLAGRPFPELPHLEEMGTIAGEMLTAALDHLVRADAEQAILLCRRDEQVDSLLDRLTHQLAAVMSGDPREIVPGMALLRVGRNLERIADLATNIAEDVVYVVEGRRFQRSRDTAGARLRRLSV